MKPKEVTFGIALSRRYVFSREDAHRYKNLVEDKLRQWDVDFIKIDELNEDVVEDFTLFENIYGESYGFL